MSLDTAIWKTGNPIYELEVSFSAKTETIPPLCKTMPLYYSYDYERKLHILRFWSEAELAPHALTVWKIVSSRKKGYRLKIILNGISISWKMFAKVSAETAINILGYDGYLQQRKHGGVYNE